MLGSCAVQKCTDEAGSTPVDIFLSVTTNNNKNEKRYEQQKKQNTDKI
jgi:hypothetical protein